MGKDEVDVTKVPMGNGEIHFKLEELLKEKHISKNQMMRDTETDFKVIQRIAKGTITKVDLYVLTRLCDYLVCDIDDIIEYKKND